MRTNKIPLFLALAALFMTSFNAAAAVSCAPLVATKIASLPFSGLNGKLTPRLVALKGKLDAVKNQATYQTLLAEANADAVLVPKGRILVTLPDGTVVVDTSKGVLNTYANFVAKKINENHNSRVAILDTQLFECGLGVETKKSTTDGVVETYVARRLGNYLDNSGTVRISSK
jgi:NAD-dependent oxidoreductase involved in siderophore biosynthesis